jgi:hypothetical protein
MNQQCGSLGKTLDLAALQSDARVSRVHGATVMRRQVQASLRCERFQGNVTSCVRRKVERMFLGSRRGFAADGPWLVQETHWQTYGGGGGNGAGQRNVACRIQYQATL